MISEDNFKSCLYVGPVNSLEILDRGSEDNSFLISSSGSFIKLFCLETRCLHCVCRVFDDTKIHGIIISRKREENLFLVFGANKLEICRVNYLKNNVELLLLIDTDDWIKDAVILYNDDSSFFGVGICFARNFVEIYKVGCDFLQYSKVYSVQCKTKCLLYSAKFYGNRLANLKVASGTIFNEILLWSIENPSDMRVFSGHDGVIFNLSFPDDFQTLISTSDDRSVRAWDIKSGTLTKSFFGHGSRVWRALKFKNYIFSVGEDASCKVWDYDREVCLETWVGHSVKNIWSLAIGSFCGVVATGGGDGDIRIWRMSEICSNVTTFPNLSLKNNLNLRIKSFSLLGQQHLAVCTHCNHIFEYKFIDGSWNNYRLLFHDPKLSSYKCIFSYAPWSLLFVGDLYGALRIISYGDTISLFTFDITKGKLLSIYCEESNSQVLNVFISSVMTDKIQECIWFKLKRRNGHLEVFNKKIIKTSDKSLMGNDLYHTCAATLTASGKEYVLVGTRKSEIFLFVVDLNPSLIGDDEILYPSFSSLDVHDGNAITCIRFMEDTIISTGRDGKLRSFKFCKLDNSFLPKTVVKITKGWLEGIATIDAKIFVVGFYEKKAFIYDVNLGQEVFAVNCGGVHRLWEFQIFKNNSLSFIYTKHFEIVYSEKNFICDGEIMKSHGLSLKSNGDAFHSRETRCVSFVNENVLLTGSEDCSIKALLNISSKLTVFQSLRKHQSSVTSFSVNKLLDDFLIFSAGGMENLICWRAEIKNTHLENITFQSSCFPICDIQDVRIMSIDSFSLNELDIKFNQNYFVVCVVNADAFMRILAYDSSLKKFFIIGKLKDSENCFQKIKCKIEDGQCYLYTTSTDGIVRKWNVTKDILLFFENFTSTAVIVKRICVETGKTLRVQERCSRLLSASVDRYQLHQSGIDAISIFKNILITGGDDNSICLFNGMQKYTLSRAHSSSIKEIKTVGVGKNNLVISVGSDQKLKLWILNDRTLEIQLWKTFYSNVCDISCMDVRVKKETDIEIVVAGIGIEFFRNF
jgi:WD40 repeat protein